MGIRFRRGSAWLAVGIVATLLAGPVCAALWYESYDRAKKALEDENWREAIQQIDLAIQAKGESSARARTYGVNFEAYFPYFTLGKAYYHLGQLSGDKDLLDRAQQAFDTEEQLGQIAESAADLAELQRYRGLIDQANADAAEEERRRIEKIVADNLAEVDRLEQSDQLDEALLVLGNALAVAPDHPAANAAKHQLLDKIAQRQAQADLEQRVAGLVEQGRTELAAGRYQEAATLFSRALNLEPGAEVRALFDEAQDGLRQQLEAEQSAERRARSITEGLSEARRLQQAGELVPALEQLQTVLALDPGNSEAISLQQRVLAAQADTEQDAVRRQSVQTLLATARESFDAGRFEQSLSSAHTALAVDPGNAEARGYIARAYAAINQNLLGNRLARILFADFREELEDGTRAETVRTADYQLTGSVYDDTEVTLAFQDAEGNSIGRQALQTEEIEGTTITQFTFRHRLPAGATTVHVVATDASGEEVTETYAVVYLVPWFRSPWFYSAIAAALAIAGLGFAAQRMRRRNELLKRKFNPYIAGAPILKDEIFYGRERLLDYVLQRVHNNSILLYGERRIGKTSFQHRLKRRLANLRDPNYRFLPVYIDLQGTPQDQFFATLAHDIFSEPTLGLDGLKPDPSIANGADYDHRAFITDTQKVLKALQKSNEKQVKLVLLIDEVDELNEYDPRVNQRLRSLFMKTFAENLVAVVSGVGIKKQWEREGSPWYNFFQEIEVKPFQKEDAKKLIEEPIRGIFQLDSGVTDRIMDLTHCKPYVIQKICADLVDRLHGEHRRRITLKDVEVVSPRHL